MTRKRIGRRVFLFLGVALKRKEFRRRLSLLFLFLYQQSHFDVFLRVLSVSLINLPEEKEKHVFKTRFVDISRRNLWDSLFRWREKSFDEKSSFFWVEENRWESDSIKSLFLRKNSTNERRNSLENRTDWKGKVQRCSSKKVERKISTAKLELRRDKSTPTFRWETPNDKPSTTNWNFDKRRKFFRRISIRPSRKWRRSKSFEILRFPKKKSIRLDENFLGKRPTNEERERRSRDKFRRIRAKLRDERRRSDERDEKVRVQRFDVFPRFFSASRWEIDRSRRFSTKNLSARSNNEWKFSRAKRFDAPRTKRENEWAEILRSRVPFDVGRAAARNDRVPTPNRRLVRRRNERCFEFRNPTDEIVSLRFWSSFSTFEKVPTKKRDKSSKRRDFSTNVDASISPLRLSNRLD